MRPGDAPQPRLPEQHRKPHGLPEPGPLPDEVVRQKAGGCKADIDDADGWITIRR